MRAIPLAVLVVLTFGPFGSTPSDAQTGCRTANCAQGAAPAGCMNRASPRTMRVLMTGDGFVTPFSFAPSGPKIEPGDCVEWVPATVVHSSTGSACPDTGGICNAPPPPPPCEWESGNAAAGEPSVFCHYAEGTFPGGTAKNFYCRIHATPTTGTMRGALQVTTKIVLTANKDVPAGDVLLSWTGGGITGDETFKVVRSDNDPKFATPSTVDPQGGPAGRSYRDVGQLNQPGNRFYLVRNRQTNE